MRFESFKKLSQLKTALLEKTLSTRAKSLFLINKMRVLHFILFVLCIIIQTVDTHARTQVWGGGGGGTNFPARILLSTVGTITLQKHASKKTLISLK